jgi:indole-3-glycerol phosphate synthase
MNGLLDRIVATKRAEVDALKRAARRAHATRTTCDVRGALRVTDALALVAEIKFRSPSAGALSRAMDASARATSYAVAGARMVSVLCDEPFFGGSYDDVTSARRALDAHGFAHVPILAKEFVLDETQVEVARAAGADAALLIARILPGDDLARLVRACRAIDLEPFVEVADESELARALAIDAHVIGVNTRDLDTLAMDAERTARVVRQIPTDRVAVHLSGVRGPEDVAAIAKTRADAALVGEALMREEHPNDLLKRMLARANK